MANQPLIIDSADKVPPIPARPPHHIISGGDFAGPRARRLDWPWHVSAVLGLVALALLGFLVYRIDQALHAWAESSPAAAWLATFSAPAIIGVLLCILLYRLASWAYYSTARQRYEAYQAGLARTRLGVPVAADVIAVQGWQQAVDAEQQAIALELGRAPYTRYPLLSTLSEGSSEQSTATIYGAPSEEAGPSGVPSSDWLRWIDETPHLMIAGRTNAGKTTLASAILAERIQAGDEVLIIDPHDQPEKWFGVAAIGGGRRYDAILSVLDQVVREMDARYVAYNGGTPTSAFTRLTVLVDEVPAIMDACLNEHRRIIDGRWSQFARKLGSEARKVRISVILLTQSVLVQDIGINTAMRKNFSRIALGDEARRLLGEESDRERRGQLEEAIRGQAHPAVMEYLSEIHVLDTRDVQALARQDVSRLARAWAPSASVSAQNGHKPPDPSIWAQTDTRQTWGREKKLAVIQALREAGLTREQARARLAKVGEGLDNDDWAAAA